ncbi:MAG: hypothetical protein ABR511_10180 [Acidimicrobiales bacterium]
MKRRAAGDRRVPFFLGSALVCLLLVPLADAQFRWVAWWTAAVYVVLAGAVALDAAARGRPRRRGPEPPTAPTDRGTGEHGGTW